MEPLEIHAALVAAFGDRIRGKGLEALSPFAIVDPAAIAEVAAFCKADAALAFDNLMCLSGVDYPKETPPRMEVVYHLYSYRHRHAFALKAQLPRDNAALPSVERVWGAASWHEREAWDLFGIAFTGHSDLRRILLPDDWDGHPMRKDWRDPEYYNGLHVKPTPQMAERVLAGEPIGVGPFDFTPANRSMEEP